MAMCIKNRLFDLIFGYVPLAKKPNDTNPGWKKWLPQLLENNRATEEIQATKCEENVVKNGCGKKEVI